MTDGQRPRFEICSSHADGPGVQDNAMGGIRIVSCNAWQWNNEKLAAKIAELLNRESVNNEW